MLKRIALTLLAAAVGLAQAQLEFDAASIKMSDFPKDGGPAIGLRFETGRFLAVYVSMQDLIQAAYAVPAGYKIVGPDWIDSMSVRYSITAKAAGPAPTKDLRMMLQNLLAARCQLKVHMEDRPGEIYALVVLPKGIKLTPVKFDGDDPNSGAVHYGRDGMEFKHTSMALLANRLTLLGHPVEDETGSKDLYDFALTYANRGGSPVLVPPIDSDQPSIFTALQQIGLKLESRKGSVHTWVVDRVEKVPAGN